MTATSSPSTPEHAPTRAPLSDSERAVYSLATVEQWRTKQQGILQGLREAASPDIADTTYVDTFNDSVDDSLDEFLREQGVDATSANYAEIRHLFRNASIDTIHDSEWYASPASRGVDAEDNLSERDKLALVVNERRGSGSGVSDEHEPGQFDAELKETMDNFAKELAKRSREVMTFREGKSMAQYREDLTDLIGGVATEMMLDYFDDETKEWKPGQKDVAVAAIDTFVGEQMEKLVGSLETAYGDYEKKRSVVTRYLMRKWGEWGPAEEKVSWRERLFNKGSFKKSVPFIVGGVAVGAASWLLLPVVGAVGAGVAIGAGIGAKLSSAIGRSYARIKLDSAAEADNKGQARAKQLYAMMIAERDASHEELLKLASETANDYRNRNRIRMLSSSAIAAATSGGVAALIDQLVPGDFSGLLAKPIESVRKWWESHNPTGQLTELPKVDDKKIDPKPPKIDPEKYAQIKDTIDVDKGGGLISEMKQSAKVAGYDVDGKTATKLYWAVRKEFGNDGIIDINGIDHDTYLKGNDLRLSAPGKAVWKDGVSDFMEKWLTNHGHGHEGPAVEPTGSVTKETPLQGIKAVEQLRGVPQIYSVDVGKPYDVDFDANGTIDGHLTPDQTRNLSELTEVKAGDTVAGAVENVTNYAGLARLGDQKLNSLLEVIGKQMSEMRFKGTLIPLTHYDEATHQWMLNVPEGVSHPELPDAAVRTIAREVARTYRSVA